VEKLQQIEVHWDHISNRIQVGWILNYTIHISLVSESVVSAGSKVGGSTLDLDLVGSKHSGSGPPLTMNKIVSADVAFAVQKILSNTFQQPEFNCLEPCFPRLPLLQLLFVVNLDEKVR